MFGRNLIRKIGSVGQSNLRNIGTIGKNIQQIAKQGQNILESKDVQGLAKKAGVQNYLERAKGGLVGIQQGAIAGNKFSKETERYGNRLGAIVRPMV